MHQMQRRAAERADAEDRDVLGIVVWAQDEEFCDCHPFDQKMDGALLKITL